MRIIVFMAVMFLVMSPVHSAQFELLHTVEVGNAPHGIRIADNHAYVAVSGDDEIAVVDLQSMQIKQRWPIAKSPLDLVQTANGWLVAPFRDERLVELSNDNGQLLNEWPIASGPSLFTPQKVGDLTYIVSEFEDSFTVFDTASMQIVKSYPTGKRPYPADVTRDGVLAFVPNRDANTVSVIDLLNQKEIAKTPVCAKPEGGALTNDQVYYLVACSGSDKVVWVNTASLEVEFTTSSSIGPRPFSIAMSEDGLWAFVNNAGSNNLSIIEVKKRAVVARIATGDQPIVMRVAGDRLYVTNEVSGTLSIIAIPTQTKPDQEAELNEVVVLGTIHGEHKDSEKYSLPLLSKLLEATEPDYVLTEIPPNRLRTAQQDFIKSKRIREARVSRFPEYTDVLFPLTDSLDFEIIPAAAWNTSMNDYRSQALEDIENDRERRRDWAAHQAAFKQMDQMIGERDDDPLFIHTDEYDAIIKQGFRPYDKFFNDELGTGGWTTINQAHYRLIEQALDDHSGEGKRFVITFGAAHKYWFLEQLRKRNDIRLLDATPFIQQAQQTLEDEKQDDGSAES